MLLIRGLKGGFKWAAYFRWPVEAPRASEAITDLTFAYNSVLAFLAVPVALQADTLTNKNTDMRVDAGRPLLGRSGHRPPPGALINRCFHNRRTNSQFITSPEKTTCQKGHFSKENSRRNPHVILLQMRYFKLTNVRIIVCLFNSRWDDIWLIILFTY